jgi:hypothetical protein
VVSLGISVKPLRWNHGSRASATKTMLEGAGDRLAAGKTQPFPFRS